MPSHFPLGLLPPPHLYKIKTANTENKLIPIMKGQALGPTVATTKAAGPAIPFAVPSFSGALMGPPEATPGRDRPCMPRRMGRHARNERLGGGGNIARRQEKLRGDKKYCAVARKLRGSKEGSNRHTQRPKRRSAYFDARVVPRLAEGMWDYLIFSVVVY